MVKTKYYTVFYLLLLFFMTMCKHAVIPFSREEKELRDSIKNICKCDLFFEHDYNAIIKHRSDGIFSIQFQSDQNMKKWCGKDTSFLKNFSLRIAQKLNKIITNRGCYNSITIGFSSFRQEDRRSIVECDISFKFNLAELREE